MTKRWHYLRTGRTFTVEPREDEPWPGFDFEVARKTTIQWCLTRAAAIANNLGAGAGELLIVHVEDEVINPELTFPAKRGDVTVHFLAFGQSEEETTGS